MLSVHYLSKGVYAYNMHTVSEAGSLENKNIFMCFEIGRTNKPSPRIILFTFVDRGFLKR